MKIIGVDSLSYKAVDIGNLESEIAYIITVSAVYIHIVNNLTP